MAIVSPQRGPPAHLVLRRERLGPHPRARSTSGSTPTEIGYIVEHCGASVLLVDPELDDDARRASTRTAPLRHRRRGRRRALFALDRRAASRGTPDEDATATINYTSGTTARPKGVQLTHRNLWLNATTFGWQAGCQRPRRLPAHAADVPLQRLGHALRRSPAWAAPRSCCARSTAPRSCAASTRTASRCCAAPRRSWPPSSTPPPTWDGPIPGAGTHPHRRGRRPAADPHHRAGRDRAGLGVHPDLRPHRDDAAAHDEPGPGRVRRPDARPSGPSSLGRAGAPALGVQMRGRRRGRGAGPGQPRAWRATGSSPRPRPTPSSTAGSTPATAGSSTTSSYVTISDRKKDVIISGGENVSSIEVEDALFSHPAVAEVAVIGVPDEKWGETVKALVVLAPGADGHRGRAHRPLPRPTWPTTSARRRSSSATSWPAPPPASSRSSSSGRRYWEGREREVN